MDDDTPAIEPELEAAPKEGEPALEYKNLSFELKLDELDEEGQFEGYASVFDNEDAHGDVIEKGAFKKTIKEQKGRVPILWQHDPWEPIGISLELEEDDHGLHTRGQLVLETQRGAECYALFKREALKGLSIGYQAIKYLIDKDSLQRRIKEIRLWEYSPVTFPANRLAVVSRVKSADVMQLAEQLRRLREADPETVKALLEEREPAPPARELDGAAGDERAVPAVAATLLALTHDIRRTTTKETRRNDP